MAKHIALRFNTLWEPFIIVFCEKKRPREQAQARFDCGFRKSVSGSLSQLKNKGEAGFAPPSAPSWIQGFPSVLGFRDKHAKCDFQWFSIGIFFGIPSQGPLKSKVFIEN